MPAAPSIRLQLPFKGSRDYLHSTDLFPALNGLVQEQFSPHAFVELLTIRRAVNHCVEVRFAPPSQSFGSFRIRRGEERIDGWLVETQESIHARIPYDDAPAVRAAKVEPGAARFDRPVEGQTPFEQLLVLMRLVSAQVAKRHWWLCQINLRSPFTAQFPLEFRSREQIFGRFLRGGIWQGGRLIGSAAGFADLAHRPQARQA
jgi:hypothetical protein